LVPLIWVFTGAFKTTAEIWRIPPTLFPHEPTLEGFRMLFQTLPYGRMFLNSVFVASVQTGLILFTSSITGYVFAKFEFPGKSTIFVLMLITLMLPFEAIMIALYVLMKLLRWLDTYRGLILPGAVSAFGIFLMRQFATGIPGDYIDAARIDGLSELGIYVRIVLPLMKAPLFTLAIIMFRRSWDAFLWPLVVINSEVLKTMPLGMASLAGTHGARMEVLVPAIFISVLPVLAVFFLCQRHLVAGVALTGIKG